MKKFSWKNLIFGLLVLVMLIIPAPLTMASVMQATDQPVFILPAEANDITPAEVITDEELTDITVTQTSINNYEVKYNGTNKKIKIGNGTTSFTPTIVINAWNEECQVELTLDSNVTGAIRNSLVYNPDGSLTIGNNNFSFYYKPVTVIPEFNEYGGLDFILTVNKNPKTNVLPFIYNTTQAVAYWQPPLTEEYTAGWNEEFQDYITVTETDVFNSEGVSVVHQPDYVVNSIAFYHETKGGMDAVGEMQYKTGKVGHLYRLKVTDSSAVPKTAWGDWTVSGSNIYLTVDPVFMNTATYPVTIAPVGDTFGYTTAGSSNTQMTVNYIQAWYTAYTGAAGTATGMSIYAANTEGNSSFKPLIYAGTDLIDNGIANAILIDAGAQWWNAGFATNPTIEAISYYLAVVSSASTKAHMYYDYVTGYRYASSNYLSPADPVSWTAVTYDRRKFSVYCTYTPSGGGGWTVITKINGSTATDFGKIDTIDVGDIAKVCGVSVN